MNTVVPVLPQDNSRAQSSATQPAPAAAADSGLACLVMLSQFHAVAADPEKLRHEFSRDGQAMDVVDILNAAKSLGLVAARRRPSRVRLALAALPAIALANDGGFFILARVDQDKALIQEPGASGPQVLELSALHERWSGELIQITSRASLAGEMAKFDFSWFIPAVVKYRRPLVEVLLVSFVLQFFMLVTPLFLQVVMDKVLVHNGLTTLHVVCIGLLVISVFDVVLTGLRSYVFAHTSSRIDVELGARLFRHLLSLPMGKVDSEDSWLLFVVMVALAAFVAWKFSTYLGLDMATGGQVLARLAVLVVLTGLSWKLRDDFPRLGPRAVWPLLLSLLWLCWWPALDFWAAKNLPASLLHEETLPWWAAWYTKWGVLLGIAALGHLGKKVFRRS
ncbi:cysteine peptidase family C39 domain-containing protein [Polaromonas sp. JS666]|uniref:cysteine peptidase family C39 domain-containing protein n=1 Tax=Polaromonas sp. (strain JS666 / ATCC BAA-500) TaxID=296591 RepID=UPI00210F3FCD|nr:cysteine peptidase family C39 domain-containing protein [Polaromonas sp. JS666]